jgi:hypothetical protein
MVACERKFAWLPVRLLGGRKVWLRLVYRCVTQRGEWYALSLPPGAA